MTAPVASTSAPPGQEPQSGASVWISPWSTWSGPSTLLPSALITPVDTVGEPASAIGEPRATAIAPTSRRSAEPRTATGKPSPSMSSTARSVSGSVPSSAAGAALPVAQLDDDHVGLVDDVRAGEHQTVVAEDHARSARGGGAAVAGDVDADEGGLELLRHVDDTAIGSDHRNRHDRLERHLFHDVVVHDAREHHPDQGDDPDGQECAGQRGRGRHGAHLWGRPAGGRYRGDRSSDGGSVFPELRRMTPQAIVRWEGRAEIGEVVVAIVVRAHRHEGSCGTPFEDRGHVPLAGWMRGNRLRPPTGTIGLRSLPTHCRSTRPRPGPCSPSCGGTVTFTGTARDHAEGRIDVHQLEYEAYESPAVARMTRGRRGDPTTLAGGRPAGDAAPGRARSPITEAAVVVVAVAPPTGPRPSRPRGSPSTS